MDSSILVGDRLTDIEAGEAAGLRRLFLVSDAKERQSPDTQRYVRVSGLPEVVEYLAQSSPAQQNKLSE
jgi:histidinol phosphatase-like enzyme